MVDLTRTSLPRASARYARFCAFLFGTCIVVEIGKMLLAVLGGRTFIDVAAQTASDTLGSVMFLTMMLSAGYAVWFGYVATDRRHGYPTLLVRLRFANVGLTAAVAGIGLAVGGDLQRIAFVAASFMLVALALESAAYLLGWGVRLLVHKP